MDQRPTSKQRAGLVRVGLPLALAILGTAACQTNQNGHLSAVKMGDTSHPATRGSPVDELRAACGSDGTLTEAGTASIRRHPYLQQVTSSSAMLGWVTTAPDGTTVEVKTAQGEPVSATDAAAEAAKLGTVDEQQMWARLDGLRPDTIYCYTLQGASGPLSLPTGFRTAPAADAADPARPVRFLAFGDSGGGDSDQYALLDQMFAVPHDLIVHTGDLAYGNGTMGEIETKVFDVYTDLLRNIPMFPVPGNHDYGTQSGAPFRQAFSLPSENEKWYSYDWGRVHFVGLDTESDYATQAKWLEEDLASSTQPWKVVVLHKPPYSTGTHGSDTKARKVFAPIFERHGVQLVLTGHDHHYERTSPQGGITYVVTGGGGMGTRAASGADFTAFTADVIHYVYVEVGADELSLHAIDASGVEFDSAVIAR